MPAAASAHPGRVMHVWDHYVITLREPDGRESFLSWYAITWSPEVGAGDVAILRWHDRDGVASVRVLARPVTAGRAMRTRLHAMGATGMGRAGRVVAATFERRPQLPGGGFGVRIRAAGLTVEAAWAALEDPAWVDGPAPAFWEREDISACFVPARRAALEVNGRSLPGRPFDDPSWLPKLGRPLSSAHVALAEVRLEPVRATGP